MKTVLSKLNRMPMSIKLLLVTVVVGLAVLTYFIPYWIEFAFFMVVIGLFCPNFNILGGGCSSTSFHQYVFGWLVILLAGWILYLACGRIHRWWQQL